MYYRSLLSTSILIINQIRNNVAEFFENQQKLRETLPSSISKSSYSEQRLDNCDHYKWRTCQTDADCAWDIWKDSTYFAEG